MKSPAIDSSRISTAFGLPPCSMSVPTSQCRRGSLSISSFFLAAAIILAYASRQYCTCNSAMLHFDFAMSHEQSIDPVRGKRVALGVTGGIAAYKAVEILRGLQRAGCEVRVAMTRNACEFITPLTFRSISGAYVVVD